MRLQLVAVIQGPEILNGKFQKKAIHKFHRAFITVYAVTGFIIFVIVCLYRKSACIECESMSRLDTLLGHYCTGHLSFLYLLLFGCLSQATDSVTLVCTELRNEPAKSLDKRERRNGFYVSSGIEVQFALFHCMADQKV